MTRWLLALLLVGCPKPEPKPVEKPAANLAEQAERLGRRLTDAGARTLLIAELGSAFAREGKTEQCLPYLDEARTLAAGLTTTERESVLAAIAAALALTGELGKAQETAKEIGGNEARSDALASIVTKLAERGAFDDAKVLIDAITITEKRGAAQVDLVKGLLAAGHMDRAGRAAALIKEANKRDEATAAVAVALFEARKDKRANSALASLGSPHWRAEAVAAMARMRYRAGARSDAEEITKSIESHWIRARTYADLSGLAARSGRKKAGERLLALSIDTASAVNDSVLRATALTDIAIRLIDRGQLEAAAAVLDKTTSVTRRKADAHLAGWYARNNQVEEGLRIHATLADDVIYGSEAASQIALARADQGRFLEALEMAARIRTRELRLPVLAEIAVRHALSGAPVDDRVTERLEAALFAEAVG